MSAMPNAQLIRLAALVGGISVDDRKPGPPVVYARRDLDAMVASKTPGQVMPGRRMTKKLARRLRRARG